MVCSKPQLPTKNAQWELVSQDLPASRSVTVNSLLSSIKTAISLQKARRLDKHHLWKIHIDCSWFLSWFFTSKETDWFHYSKICLGTEVRLTGHNFLSFSFERNMHCINLVLVVMNHSQKYKVFHTGECFAPVFSVFIKTRTSFSLHSNFPGILIRWN